MTYEPPAPPPPPPPPPPAGPPTPPPPPPAGPPPGGYGPPPASGGTPFDPKAVNPLDWGILAAGFFAFVFSFTSYYSYKLKVVGFDLGTGHWDAWHGFFGWFAALLALAGSALVAITLFAPQTKLPFGVRLACLGAYAVAALFVILAIFVIPSPGGYNGPGLDKGHGYGFWISLIVILGGLVLSLMRAQQTGTQLPGPLSKMPKIGG